MTLRSPEDMLTDVYSSSILYSLELLEADDTPDELLSMVTEFLNQAEEVKSMVNNKEAIRAYLNERTIIK